MGREAWIALGQWGGSLPDCFPGWSGDGLPGSGSHVGRGAPGSSPLHEAGRAERRGPWAVRAGPVGLYRTLFSLPSREAWGEGALGMVRSLRERGRGGSEGPTSVPRPRRGPSGVFFLPLCGGMSGWQRRGSRQMECQGGRMSRGGRTCMSWRGQHFPGSGCRRRRCFFSGGGLEGRKSFPSYLPARAVGAAFLLREGEY